jgi:SNF2 family DNA or RNA helicase
MSAQISFDKGSKTFWSLWKSSKFLFNPITKRYETNKHWVAARLREHLDETSRNELSKYSVNVTPWTGCFFINEGLSLRHCQPEAVQFALSRNHSYLALEQGLGKTPVALTIINSIHRWDYDGQTLLIIPPFLLTNWQNEIRKWKAPHLKFAFLTTKFELANFNAPDVDVIVVTDSIVASHEFTELLKIPRLKNIAVDEAHRFNGDSLRSKALYYRIEKDKPEKVTLLSGTPIRGRYIEFWKCLRTLAWDQIRFMPKKAFEQRYCDGRLVEFEKFNRAKMKKEKVKRWAALGSSNPEELKNRIKNFVIRRKFDDYFDIGIQQRIVLIDGKVSKEIKDYEEGVLKKKKLEDFLEDPNKGAIARYRLNLSRAMMKPAVEYILNAFETTEGPMLIGAWHTELLDYVAEALKKKGFKIGVIKGGVSVEERAKITTRYMSGKLDAIVANTQTMVGLNLTRGSRIIHLESTWSPDDIAQFNARVKRDGYKGKNILVDHLALANTMHEHIINIVLKKEKDISKVF